MKSSQERLDEALRRLWKSLDELAASIAQTDERAREAQARTEALETFLEKTK